MDITAFLIDCSLISIGAGLIYGIFGGGSGLVMAPGYYYVLRHFDLSQQDHRMQIAIATTAAASAILGLASTRVQWKANNIDFLVVKKISLGIVIGTIAAVCLLNIMSSTLLKHLFGVVVILVALWMWFYNQEKDLKPWSLYSIGNYINTFLIGLLWFLFGIAVFTVPYLHKTGIDIRRAIGSATFAASLFSAVAAVLLMLSGYFKVGYSITHIGYVNLLIVLVSVIPSSIAGYVGSHISDRLPKKTLKQVYAGLIVIVGILMLR